MLSPFSHVQLFATRTVAHQASLSMEFSRQKYWSGLPCPPPRDLPDPGTESTSSVARALQADSLPLSHWGSSNKTTQILIKVVEVHNKQMSQDLFLIS